MKILTDIPIKRIIKLILITLSFAGCSSIQTNTSFYDPILVNLKNGNFDSAVNQIEEAELNEEFAKKDRVLLHLDKGILFHYKGEYKKSNEEFEKAEFAIEELFTKSISKGAASLLLNDNALDYPGEVYEDLYINIFKALNYLHLNNFDDAYVEVRRITNKLEGLDIKYEEYVASLNKSDEAKFEISTDDLNYYNNVLSNYLSSLIFRAEGEYDNERISLQKLNEAWESYPDVYNYDKPNMLTDTTKYLRSQSFLNILSFAGTAPVKKPVGARITTFNDYVVVSDPTNFHIQPILIPGIKYGWNFKFEFPALEEGGTFVDRIEVYIDSMYYCDLELLENMANVARKTFEMNKGIIFFKTIMRAIAKGIGSSALGREVKKEAKGIWGDVLAGVINAAVDATENADLRCWRTMPAYCFAGQIPLDTGEYNIELHFISVDGSVLSKRIFPKYELGRGLNLVEAYYLN